MKKLAKIITITDPLPNYGNRLQNYAAQFVLQRLGLDTVTISIEKCDVSFSDWIKYLLQSISFYHLPGNSQFWKYEFRRKVLFYKFNKKYIHMQKIKSIDEIGKADFFVIGSDQVWNPNWYKFCPLKKDLFLLTFANPSQKVCFSPSFGINTIPQEWENWFKEQLLSFPKLGVREKTGAKIIYELTGRVAEVTIDPTLMLTVSDWLAISKRPKQVDLNEPYILLYFLGGISENRWIKINEISTKLNLNVYNLMDKYNKSTYNNSPEEFIYLYSHASLVLTDSFHACVFSFLFGKPFLVYDRDGKEQSIMSRINTFLKTFFLERKYVNSNLKNNLLEANYDEGYKQLEIERKKTLDFLKKSMSME